MESPRILLVLAIALLFQIVGAALTFDTAWTSPEAHPDFASMDVGGQRAAQDFSHWWFGLIFGLTIIAFLTCCLTLAAEELRTGRSLRVLVWLGGSLYATVFVVMMSHTGAFESGEPVELLGPFPAATTWMVYGLWMVPAVFVIIYVVGFDRWFSLSEPGGESASEETAD